MIYIHQVEVSTPVLAVGLGLHASKMEQDETLCIISVIYIS